MKAFKSLKPSTWMIFGALLWGVLVVFLLFQFISDRLISFDEDQVIHRQFTTVEAYLDAVGAAFEYTNDGQIQIIRVEEQGCVCNGASVGHWAQVKQQYSEVSFQDMSVRSLSDAQQALVPATPMAVIFDTDGTLMYAGPFSDANYCNSDNSFIDAYLNQSLKQRFSPLSAVGCYCKNS
ncbi:hypothetical protein KO489_09300 [Reinekea forsetii]|nr:hypothetical protein [Reinekea forsetii]